jgi:translation elongation factor EF-Tu-like GTPase
VEDVFTITGRGTVVTGRVGSGQLRTGQRVVVQRGAQTLAEVEVTGIEMFRKTTDVASAGDNVGLLLAGVSRSDVQRGDVLTA